MEKRITAVSLWNMIRRQGKGLGNCNFGIGKFGALASRLGFRLVRYDSSVVFTPEAGTLSLPTMLRQVSGRKRSIPSRHDPERMQRSQKIHLQLARSVKTPPTTGPKLGAVFGLAVANQYDFHRIQRE